MVPLAGSAVVHALLMLLARHAPSVAATGRHVIPMRVAQPKKPSENEAKPPPPRPIVRAPRKAPRIASSLPPPPSPKPHEPPPPAGFSVDEKATTPESSVAVAARPGGGNMFADPNDGAPPAPKTTAPPPPPPPAPARFEPPELLTDELSRLPPYPSAALRAEIDGQVLLRVCIAPSGAVDTVQVVKGLGFGCDEAASAWARSHWRFKPARRGGTPITYCIMQPVRFQLQR